MRETATMDAARVTRDSDHGWLVQIQYLGEWEDALGHLRYPYSDTEPLTLTKRNAERWARRINRAAALTPPPDGGGA